MSPKRRMSVLPAAVLALTALLPGATQPAAAAGPVRLYPLGDSITYGATVVARVPEAGVSQLVNTPGGYRGVLDGLLTGAGVAHQFVGTRTDNSTPVLDATGQQRHDGWPGWRIDQIDGRLGTWVPATLPDVVVVHLGTNDIGQRWDPGTTYPTGDGRVNLAVAAQRATFVSHMTTRLDALVDKLQALKPDVRIVLSNVVPWASGNGTGAPQPVTAEYSAAIQDVVAAERTAGEKVVFADVWTPFVANGSVIPGLLSTDNVHPTPVGYAVMADVYDDAVLAAVAL